MAEIRKAVVIGIDAYPGKNALQGCVRDANDVASLLRCNGNGDSNFETKMLTSDLQEISTQVLNQAVDKLFSGDASTAVFYFAGHGIIDPVMDSGYLVAQNGSKGAWGLSLSELVNRANKAYPRIQSTVIVLDCCHSGFAGEVASLGDNQISAIGNGVTIIAASDRDGTASEDSTQGLFTSILLDGLRGSASDIVGNITPPSLYSLVDQTLGAFEQRPIYKANVKRFVSLRQVTAKIPNETLRKLPGYFKRPDDIYPLDPLYEPDRQNIPERYRHLPLNPTKIAIFRELQACNRQGLIIPEGVDNMFDAAINSTGCRLTATGKHYRKLAELGRFGQMSGL
jgi:hypothetical protein